jgi:hypothetical protein
VCDCFVSIPNIQEKINFEEQNLTQADYLQSIKEAVIVQSCTQKVLLQEN